MKIQTLKRFHKKWVVGHEFFLNLYIKLNFSVTWSKHKCVDFHIDIGDNIISNV